MRSARSRARPVSVVSGHHCSTGIRAAVPYADALHRTWNVLARSGDGLGRAQSRRPHRVGPRGWKWRPLKLGYRRGWEPPAERGMAWDGCSASDLPRGRRGRPSRYGGETGARIWPQRSALGAAGLAAESGARRQPVIRCCWRACDGYGWHGMACAPSPPGSTNIPRLNSAPSLILPEQGKARHGTARPGPSPGFIRYAGGLWSPVRVRFEAQESSCCSAETACATGRTGALRRAEHRALDVERADLLPKREERRAEQS
ncbi:hypothetical protein Mp_1g20120 [Marchantia polymorpha subsp. ruderalis]|uniref:Uncharacterized protein n=2 Tax=Marchantia polymorpha TaxID=3197 RepID=A0AAF6AS58_MARPO|nr:hypothetical protein MARPO_0001s0349 [Marchantia polymorpha]BBM99278.1 hypothetical protein Mp_1g20120 [Marchantia polymorpha subsp. ruderalis]|eukprot:PTQ50360.1 hypothetical protein MARPO_0001s0349 [Marchantia polymorpha]